MTTRSSLIQLTLLVVMVALILLVGHVSYLYETPDYQIQLPTLPEGETP